MSEMFLTRRGGGGAGLNFEIVDSIDAPQSKSKNLIVYPYFHTTQTVNGITFTDNGDGTVTAKGTATATTHFRMSENTVDSGLLYLESGTYTLSGCPAGGSTTGYMLQAWDAVNNTKVADDTGNGATFTLSKTTAVRVAIVVQSGVTLSSLTYKPQLEKGSAATAFVKYKQKENTIWIQSDSVAESVVKNYDFSAKQPFLRSNNKNLLCHPFYHASGHASAGITYTDNGDGTVTANGTATGTSIFRVSYGWNPSDNCILLDPGTYTLSGCPAGGADGSAYVVELYKINPDGTSNERFAIDTGNGVTFTLDKPQLVRCSIVVYSGKTVSGLVFKPQLEKGSAATSFVKGDATGQVWIETGSTSSAEFNALKKNAIQVYSMGAKQVVGGEWVDRSATIYQGGAWKNFRKYLFNDGDQCLALTGGWHADLASISPYVGNGGGVVIDTTIAMRIYQVSEYYQGAAICTTKNKIDLTDVKTITVKASVATNKGASDSFCIGASANYTPWNTSGYWNCAAYKQLTYGTDKETVLDVSALSGSFYIAFGGNSELSKGGTITISEVYLT